MNALAVSDQETTLELHLPATNANSGWASIVQTPLRTNHLSVPTITIDNYISKHGIGRVDLIKMDIEGAELRALHGMRHLLARDDAQVLYVEINPFLLNKQQIEPQTIKRFLVDYGYSLFALGACNCSRYRWKPLSRVCAISSRPSGLWYRNAMHFRSYKHAWFTGAWPSGVVGYNWRLWQRVSADSGGGTEPRLLRVCDYANTLDTTYRLAYSPTCAHLLSRFG